MSDGGYTLSYRAKWQHPIFRNLRDAAVWAWMTDTAAWRETTIRYNDQRVTLKRGQLITSVRFLAKGFRCSETVVRRLLRQMETDTMISTAPTHGGTVITICKYDEYQSSRHTADTPKDTPEDTGQTHPRHTADTNKNELNESNESPVDGARGRDFLGRARDAVWDAVGLKNDPTWFGDAGRVEAWLRDGADLDADILPTIKRLMAAKRDGPPRSLKYFDRAIADAKASRLAPLPAGQAKPGQSQPIKFTPEMIAQAKG